jgi:hypothetical protein
VSIEDYPLLQRFDLSPELIHRYRYRGSTPSPDQWAQMLWNTVLLQFIVESADGREPIGIIALYQVNFQNAYGYLSAAKFDPTDNSPRMMLGAAMFLEHVFVNWPLRKVYLDLPEYNLDQIAGGVGSLFEIEGQLLAHTYFDGRYWDQYFLALYRTKWAEVGGRYLRVEGLASRVTPLT